MQSRKNPSLRKIAARKIKARRLELGFTQEKLAELADLTQVFISEVENEKKAITLDTLERISTSLDKTPADLLIDD